MRSAPTTRAGLLHHALGALVAVVVRVLEQRAALAQQRVIHAPGIHADARHRPVALAPPGAGPPAFRARAGGCPSAVRRCSAPARWGSGGFPGIPVSRRARLPRMARPLVAPRSNARTLVSPCAVLMNSGSFSVRRHEARQSPSLYPRASGANAPGGQTWNQGRRNALAAQVQAAGSPSARVEGQFAAEPAGFAGRPRTRRTR